MAQDNKKAGSSSTSWIRAIPNMGTHIHTHMHIPTHSSYVYAYSQLARRQPNFVRCMACHDFIRIAALFAQMKVFAISHGCRAIYISPAASPSTAASSGEHIFQAAFNLFSKIFEFVCQPSVLQYCQAGDRYAK